MGQRNPNDGSLRRTTAVPENGGGGAAFERPARLGTYLKRLREGYGYTLRKVEERAMALGESIDNSQLSRFEKGKAVPSFDKLRALARIFNVPVQNFSDVLDLEEYESLKPHGDDYEELLKEGGQCMARGEYGLAFVTYERALEIEEPHLENGSEGADRARVAERVAESRWRMAFALKELGKLGMVEHELRAILKAAAELGPPTRMRTLLQLASLYREQGDLFLSSLIVKECLAIAEEIGDRRVQGAGYNMLGNIAFHQDRFEEAREHYEKSLALFEKAGRAQETAMVLANLGGCLVACHRFEEGVARLDQVYAVAKQHGFRRVAALALTRLGEAYVQRGDHAAARQHFAESDRVASRADDCYHDVLFLNAFRRWELAREEGAGTREKIAFGRLRHLRPLVTKRFAELDAFDRHVETTRRMS